jgi:hypothetical protein
VVSENLATGRGLPSGGGVRERACLHPRWCVPLDNYQSGWTFEEARREACRIGESHLGEHFGPHQQFAERV